MAVPQALNSPEARKIGVVMGRFCPPHRGHDFLIEAAKRGCDELFVIVIGNSRDEAYLPLVQRARWLADRFASPRVHMVPVASDLPDSEGDPAIIGAWCDLIRHSVGGRAVDRFFTSEARTYGDWTATALGAEHVCVDPDRTHVPISATIIRADPLAAAQFLDPPVLAYFQAQAAQRRRKSATVGQARPAK
jgi:NadR type nicotinamide-nucleotide adenylyltransferase